MMKWPWFLMAILGWIGWMGSPRSASDHIIGQPIGAISPFPARPPDGIFMKCQGRCRGNDDDALILSQALHATDSYWASSAQSEATIFPPPSIFPSLLHRSGYDCMVSLPMSSPSADAPAFLDAYCSALESKDANTLTYTIRESRSIRQAIAATQPVPCAHLEHGSAIPYPAPMRLLPNERTCLNMEPGRADRYPGRDFTSVDELIVDNIVIDTINVTPIFNKAGASSSLVRTSLIQAMTAGRALEQGMIAYAAHPLQPSAQGYDDWMRFKYKVAQSIRPCMVAIDHGDSAMHSSDIARQIAEVSTAQKMCSDALFGPRGMEQMAIPNSIWPFGVWQWMWDLDRALGLADTGLTDLLKYLQASGLPDFEAEQRAKHELEEAATLFNKLGPQSQVITARLAS